MASPAEGGNDNGDLRLIIFQFLSNCLEEVTRNAVALPFGIDQQHPQLACAHAREVDDADTAGLARSRTGPAYFAAAAAARHDRARFGFARDPGKEFEAFIVSPDAGRLGDEGGSFDDREHLWIIRQ